MQRTLILGALLLAGCSSAASISPEQIRPVESLEVFLSRADMVEAQFEQLKLNGTTLYKECGQFRRGRYFADHQDFMEISPEQSAQISALASELQRVYDPNLNTFDPPGKVKNMFDPGVFTIDLRQSETKPLSIKTSLDCVSTPKNQQQRSANALASALRKAAGSELCGNKEFYGFH